MNEVGNRFAKKFYLGCLASVGFGLNIDSFAEKQTDFEKHAGKIFSIPRFVFLEMFPVLGRKILKLSFTNPDFSKYLSKLCKSLVSQRNSQNLQYNDMLNNLIEVYKVNPDMTDEILYKTFVQFFSDGYESASLVLGVLLYHLTVYPDVQTRLQDEIDELFDSKDEGEEITADDITNMTYLDQCVCEGQRLGPFAMTARVCTKNWQIPETDFVIPTGTRVCIPIIGLHYDPQYWPNPLKFDPERFSSENKGNIDPITFQTFGSGPRQCLGKNLYMIETKVMLIHLFRNFSLRPFGDMPQEMVWDKEGLLGKEQIHVKIERRNV